MIQNYVGTLSENNDDINLSSLINNIIKFMDTQENIVNLKLILIDKKKNLDYIIEKNV